MDTIAGYSKTMADVIPIQLNAETVQMMESSEGSSSILAMVLIEEVLLLLLLLIKFPPATSLSLTQTNQQLEDYSTCKQNTKY